MIQTAKSVIYGRLSKKGAESFLEYAKQNVVLLASIWSSTHGTRIDPSAIVAQIPATQESVFHCLGLKPPITTQASLLQEVLCTLPSGFCWISLFTSLSFWGSTIQSMGTIWKHSTHMWPSFVAYWLKQKEKTCPKVYVCDNDILAQG